MHEARPFRVGDSTVIRVQELLLRDFKTHDIIPDWNDEVANTYAAGMVPDSLDAKHKHVVISTHSWVVRTPDHTVVVDTGVGNDKSRTMKPFDHLHEPFLERMASIDVTPESVNFVLLTHLHTDHVGWNTRLVEDEWRPTFQNAQTILPQAELERVQALVEAEGSGSPKAAFYFDSVLPVIQAGQTRMIAPEGGASIDGFEFFPTPGHCSGHMSIGFTSGEGYAFFSGDVFHHPIQVYQPGWSSVFSEDHARGHASRLWALEHMAQTEALVFTPHFASSSAGQVSRYRDGFAWQFI